MTREEAALKLSFHIMQCGMLMPIEWVKRNGEGSELSEVFRMAISALREQPRWISVSDHLPADHEEVLVCTVNRKIGKARWSEMWQKFTMSGQARVTHWMPLPQPPEVEV